MGKRDWSHIIWVLVGASIGPCILCIAHRRYDFACLCLAMFVLFILVGLWLNNHCQSQTGKSKQRAIKLINDMLNGTPVK